MCRYLRVSLLDTISLQEIVQVVFAWHNLKYQNIVLNLNILISLNSSSALKAMHVTHA